MPANYSDYYARHKLWPLSQNFVYQADNNTIYTYLDNCFYHYTFYKHVDLPCDLFQANNTNITCAGSLFVSHDDEAIILIFRGTTTSQELNEEEQFYNLTNNFPGGGTVDSFYYQGFLTMWNGGLSDAFFSAKNAYPTHELWVTGWSMGASLAALAAPYISALGYFNPPDIKLVTFEGLRVGYQDWATRMQTLVPWSYRLTHRNDAVPHLIPAPYVHHKTEIWYNNNMTEGDPYVVCPDFETATCSNSVPLNQQTWSDHPCFGGTGTCQKFTTEPTDMPML